MMSFRH